MDFAYDHVQESAFSPSYNADANETREQGDSNNSTSASNSAQSPGLNAEFQQAFKAVSSSPWGSAIGGWFSQARRQGETLYQDLQKEATEAQEQASRGFSSLREQVANRTRALSLHGAPPGPLSSVPGEEALPSQSDKPAPPSNDDSKTPSDSDRPESLPADIVKEAGTLVASLRLTAASKLKDLQRAEDAADEALLTFGRNVRDFLRDAVTINAPASEDTATSELLFETHEPGTGRKVFHSTRLDAQLHAIHTTAASFTKDPVSSAAWATWQREFDVVTSTDEIARDLEKHDELRRSMERLVPEKVDYGSFWQRYYFLRKAVEEDERRRREVLKGASAEGEEEIGWDDEDDDEEEQKGRTTTQISASTSKRDVAGNKAASESTSTLNAASLLKPAPSPRRSHEDESKSVADSDASYDIVSGATSRAMGSPKEEKRGLSKGDESEDDDWE